MAKAKGTNSSRPMTRVVLREWAQREVDDEYWHARQMRPKTREECVDGIRPCPWVSCKYNLLVDVRRTSKFTDPTVVEYECAVESCVLDVVERYPEGATQEVIAEALGVTKQAVEKVERSGIRRARIYMDNTESEFPLEEVVPWRNGK